jgi:phosphatidylserine/phosphatidylglycerophosphate/cardiolipin synthase-like enzyme
MRLTTALCAGLLSFAVAACGAELGPDGAPPIDETDPVADDARFDPEEPLPEEKSEAELEIEAEPLPPDEEAPGADDAEAVALGQAGELRRLCFSPAEDCVARLLSYLRRETRAIDVAIYHLRDHRVARLLVEKARVGVAVRVLTDRHAYTSNAPQRREVDYLAARGVPVRTNRFRGIIHNKLVVLHGQGLVGQGSMNFSAVASRKVGGRWNDEIYFFTTSGRVFARYAERFGRAWRATGGGQRPYRLLRAGADLPSFEEAERSRPTTCYENPSPDPRPRRDDAALRVCFSPDEHCTRDVVRPLVNVERSQIDIIAFRITSRYLTDLVLEKARSGVRVRMIFDRAQYSNPAYPSMKRFIDRLRAVARAGGEVALKATAHPGSMHAKAVITSSAATWSSGNYTSTSSTRVRGCQSRYYQTEDSIAARDPALVRRMRDRFDEMWESGGFASFRP